MARCAPICSNPFLFLDQEALQGCPVTPSLFFFVWGVPCMTSKMLLVLVGVHVVVHGVLNGLDLFCVFFFLGMDLNTQFVICIIFCSDFLVFIFPTSLISLINFACHFTLFSLYIGFIRFIRFFRFASRTYVFIIWIYFFKVIIIILRTCIHIIVWISVCS